MPELNLGSAVLNIVGNSSSLEASIARLQGTSLNRLRSVEAGAGSASQSLTRLGNTGAASLTKVQTGFSGLLGLLSRVSIALGGIGFAAVGTGAIRLAANLEQAEIAFSTMLGSGEKAKSFLDDLASFAASTPFEFVGLQQSSRLLLAFGFEAQNILPIMGRVGDAVAALGGGEFEIQRVVRALGQMQTKGKATAQELNQLAEVGVGGYEILREKLGLTAEEIGNLGEQGISSSVAITAILEGLGEKFGGAMAAQAQTLNGLFSTLRDNVSLTLTDLGTRAVEALNLKGVIRGFIEFTGNIRTALEQGGITGLLGQYKDQLGLIAATIAGPLVAALAVMTAGAVAALAPFVALAVGGAALYTAWKNNFLGLQDLTNTVWASLKDGIGSVLERINTSYGSLDNYKARWGEAFTAVSAAARTFYMGVRESLSNSLTALTETNPKAASLLSGLGEMFSKTVQAIGNAFVQLPNYIIAAVNSADELGTAFARIFGAGGIGLILKGFGTLLWGYVVEPFQNLVEPVAEAAAQVGQVVSNWATKLATFFKPFTDFLKSIGRSIGDAFGTVASTTVSSISDELKAGIESSSETLTTFTATSSTVQRGFAEVQGGLSGIVNAGADATNALSSNLSDIQTASQGAADAGAGLADTNTDVADTANTAAQGAINLASGTGQAGDAADAAAEAEKRLKAAVEERTKDAKVWTTRLNDEVVTGSKSAAEAAELILPIYDRVKANMARMLGSGVYDGEEYLVAKGRLEILEGALKTFLGTSKDISIDVQVKTGQDPLADLRAQIQGDARELATAADGMGWEEAFLEARNNAESFSDSLTKLNSVTHNVSVGEAFGKEAEDNANSYSDTLSKLGQMSRSVAEGQVYDRQQEAQAAEDALTAQGIALNTAQAMAEADERAAQAKTRVTAAVGRANAAVKDEGDLAGQTKQELAGYILELDHLQRALLALQQSNPQLARKLRVGPALQDLREAREEAEKMQTTMERLSQTEGGLKALGTALTGLSGMAGGGTFAGMLAGLGAGASAAAGEVNNIKDGLDQINAGDFSGGMQGILGAAQKVLAAIKMGFEQVLGEDLPAEANIAFSALDGALGGAAAGAVFGPWGAIIGGVLGGLMGLFTGITAEQKKWTEEAKKTAEALAEAGDALRNRSRSAERTNLETAQMNLEATHDAGGISDEQYYAQKRDLDNQGARLDQNEAYESSAAFGNAEDAKLAGVPQTPEVVQKRAQIAAQVQADNRAADAQYQAQVRQNNVSYSNDVNDSRRDREDSNAKFDVKSGSLESYENEIGNLRERQKGATSAGEYQQLENQIKMFQDKIDEITGSGTGGAIQGSLDWYQGEMDKLREAQGKTGDPAEYARLEASIDEYQKQIDTIKGLGAGDAAGSIDYYNKILGDKRKEFSSTTDARTRASLGAEITQLEDTIAELEKAGEAGAGVLDAIRETYGVGTEDFASSIQDALHAADYETFTDNFQEALKKKITDAIIQGQVDAEAYQGLSDMVAGALADGTVTQSELDGIQGEADRVAESQRATFDLLDNLTLFGDSLADTAGGMSDLNAELSNVPAGLKLTRMRYAAADAVTPEAPDPNRYALSAPGAPSAAYAPNPADMTPQVPQLSLTAPLLGHGTPAGIDIAGRLEDVVRQFAGNSGFQFNDAKFYGVTDVAKLHGELEAFKKFQGGRQTGSTLSK